ncbi:MAG: hypothetical protein FRX49_02320 [Trebouxia sp. A1-2]|nr:MAG: hypothetical protein FRX49_02320 [Trebouxia sp. A1-2]
MAFVLAELVVQCDAATVFKYTGVPSFKYVYIYWEALIQGSMLVLTPQQPFQKPWEGLGHFESLHKIFSITTALTSNSTFPVIGISAGQFSGGSGPGRFFPARVRFFHVTAPDLAVCTSPTKAAQSEGCSRFRAWCSSPGFAAGAAGGGAFFFFAPVPVSNLSHTHTPGEPRMLNDNTDNVFHPNHAFVLLENCPRVIHTVFIASLLWGFQATGHESLQRVRGYRGSDATVGLRPQGIWRRQRFRDLRRLEATGQPVDTTPEPEVDAAPAKRLWLPPNSCWLAAVTTCPAAAELGAAASASPAAGDAAGSTISGS